jgi:hypothetical protein
VAEAFIVDEEVLKREVLRAQSHSPSAVPAELPRRTTAAEMDSLELSLIRMMLEYPAKSSTVRESAILADFRTDSLKRFGEEILAMNREGRVMRDASSLVGTLTDGALRDKLLALLVQESPFTEELIDRLIADTIKKIRERSSKERGKTLTSKIKEAERAGNRELVDRLTLDKVSLT